MNLINKPRPTFAFTFEIEPSSIQIYKEKLSMHVKIQKFGDIQGVDTFNNEFSFLHLLF